MIKVLTYLDVDIFFDEDSLKWCTESGLQEASLPYLKQLIDSATIKKFECLEVFYDGYYSLLGTPVHALKETESMYYLVDKQGNEASFSKHNKSFKLVENNKQNRDKIRNLRKILMLADSKVRKAMSEQNKVAEKMAKEFAKL